MDFKYIVSIYMIILIHGTSGYRICDDFDLCNCYMNEDAMFVVDCSGQAHDSLPENIPQDVQILKFADNNLRKLPDELKALTNLVEIDFSENQILSIWSNTSYEFLHLRKVNLSKNNITTISIMNSNEQFFKSNHLIELDLSYNPIFFKNTYNYIKFSSLSVLNLSHCNISGVLNLEFLKLMPKLRILDISFNPIQELKNIESESLEQLDAHNCRLGFFDGRSFIRATNLKKINFSWNERLYFSRIHFTASSESLKELDISYCNLNNLFISGFSNLKKLTASGNVIRSLNEDSFKFNQRLEHINLTGNDIYYIHEKTFSLLEELKIIDLSWNVLNHINRNVFSLNKKLLSINLSRNHLNKFDSLISDSVLRLDVSWCEIHHVSKDAFIHLSELRYLDLSHNLLSEIPDLYEAIKLETLNLNFCRLKSIKNQTLQNMPFLSTLLLTGNRLTTPFDESYFTGNRALKEIELADNPWRCECSSSSFKRFYNYVRLRTDDPRMLKCESPHEVSGKTWSAACGMIWNPNLFPVSNTDKVWMFLMVSILCLLFVMCIVMSVKRAIKSRAEAARLEEARAAEENRERERRQRYLEREAQRNAPDPRDLVSPPCYEEALLLPRLDGTFASLGHLPSGSRDNTPNRIAKNKAKSEANVSKLTTRSRNISPLTITIIPQDDNVTHSADELHAEDENYDNTNSTASGSNSQLNSSSNLDEGNSTAQLVSRQNTRRGTEPSIPRRQIPKSPPPKYSEINIVRNETNAPVVTTTQERVRHESDL